VVHSCGERQVYLIWTFLRPSLFTDGPNPSLHQAVEELLTTRPELKDRIVPLHTAKPAPGPMASLDNTVAKQNLGLQEFISWKQTLSDTVDSLLALEKRWSSPA